MADSVMDSIIEKPNIKAAESKKNSPEMKITDEITTVGSRSSGVTEGCGAHRQIQGQEGKAKGREGKVASEKTSSHFHPFPVWATHGGSHLSPPAK